jgi:hypothetical protein
VSRGLLSQEEAVALLGAHAGTLRDCIDRAWARWLDHPDQATASRRTRACIVYDYIGEEVEKAFDGVPGISLGRRYGSLHMTVESTAVIKFKKFRGRGLRTSGIATNARNRFLAQTAVLDGLVITNLVVGYLLDPIEQAPAVIAVTCPTDQGNLWALDLDGLTNSAAAPVPIQPQSPDEGGTIVRSTRRAVEETSSNEE